MLKYILVFIFTISLVINKLDAKPWQYPDCRDLEVSEINFINNDTLLVTVYNQCDSCIQHQYTSLTAYLNEDTIAVEDMIASKPSPANNDEYTYTLLIKKPLQIINGLWFEMLFICDSLKQADNLVVNIPPNIILQEDRITITPDFNCNQKGIGGDFTNYDIHIRDELNNIVSNFTGASSPIIFNTTAFENHYLTIQHQSIENVRFRTMISSCDSEGGETATPQFNLFSDSLLTFEYYYNLEGERPVEELLLHPVEGLEIDNQIYTGFSAPNSVFNFATNGDILDYNFPPIRYENGNYYERRYYGEVVVLKDEVNVGDVWSTEFITVFGDTISYAFEVTAFYESYNEFGIDYENVFQLKETVYYSNGNSSQISLHYYNKEYGIISRETPPYVSGTYGPLKFIRIIGNINLPEIRINPSTSLSFSIEKVNSDDDYTSDTKDFSLKEKLARWSVNSLNELTHLIRETSYEVVLANNEMIQFGFRFNKGRNLNKDDVLLEEPNDSLNLRGEKWKYKDFQFGLDNFYREAAFIIEVQYAEMYTTLNSDEIELIKLEKALVDGEEKVYAEFNFKGEVFGVFDPNKEYEGYIITNGVFKGILD